MGASMLLPGARLSKGVPFGCLAESGSASAAQKRSTLTLNALAQHNTRYVSRL